MNEPWMRLMARRLGLAPEQEAALLAGDVRTALADRLGQDPLLTQMVAQMEQAPARRPSTAPAESADDDPGETPGIHADRALRDATEALRAAHATLRYVGQVLGACRCWGHDESCPACSGRGAPGFRTSADVEVFLAWVEPTLKRLGLRLSRAPLPSRFDDDPHRNH